MIQIYKTKLEEEKKLLEEELSDLGKKDKDGDWEATPEEDSTGEDFKDDGDMAERTEEYEEKSLKLNSLEKRLGDINSALEKIKTGGYGICENCKNEIESDRLEANPAATMCTECMNKVL